MMKRVLFLCFAAFAGVLMAGCPGRIDPPPRTTIEVKFDKALLSYHFADDIEADKDQYVFEFTSEAGSSLDVSIFSDNFVDALKATPAAGTYKFSTSKDPFTFAEAEYEAERGKASRDKDTAVKGGEFTIAREGTKYTVKGDFELADGTPLRATYVGGARPGMISEGEALTLDFNGAGTDAEASADITPGKDRIWRVCLDGEFEGGAEVELFLAVNAISGLERLPEGNFPMATEVRKSVGGTAEPASHYADDKDYVGCWLEYCGHGDNQYITYATEGKGFVKIVYDDPVGDDGEGGGEEGEGGAGGGSGGEGGAGGSGGSDRWDLYTIEFSFETPGGNTVKGRYSGPVRGRLEGVQPDHP